MIDYAAVLNANYPDAQWTLNGNTYDGLTWLSDTPKPTQAELDDATATPMTVLPGCLTRQSRRKPSLTTHGPKWTTTTKSQTSKPRAAPTTKSKATRCSSSGNAATEQNKPGSTPSPPSKPPTHTRRPHDRYQRRR